MTESQIGEYQELININLNKIKRQVNQIEPGGANRKRFNVINCIWKILGVLLKSQHSMNTKKKRWKLYVWALKTNNPSFLSNTTFSFNRLCGIIYSVKTNSKNKFPL